MNNYKFESQLDQLLLYFATQGTSRPIDINKIPSKFQNRDLPKMIDILKSLELIAPLYAEFHDGKGPVEFPNILRITPAGVRFTYDSSFIELKKSQNKRNKILNFESFTVGWNTIISILSLAISIVALFISSK